VTPVVKGKPVAFVNTTAEGVPKAGVTSVGLFESALVATAVAMLSNSVLISVPLTIFKGSPADKESLEAKLVDLV
jgi:TRAP-type mannitol/chloroaromatic compound transport system permease large subunit